MKQESSYRIFTNHQYVFIKGNICYQVITTKSSRHIFYYWH